MKTDFDELKNMARDWTPEQRAQAQKAIQEANAEAHQEHQEHLRGMYEADLASHKQLAGGRLSPRELTRIKRKWADKGLEVF